jgi:hypothetical protein
MSWSACRRVGDARDQSSLSTTTFLSNTTLWEALSAHVRDARHVDAAIAYVGKGGAKLLPLKRGSRLVVDMSPATVLAGGTDPREIEKLIRRGVHVFSRRNLHAKLVVADNTVISGSANVSRNSQQTLDEAAIRTNDRSVARRAEEFIDRLCTEPVRPEYLAECKRIYKPPRFLGQGAGEKNSPKRATHAKLWIVNLREAYVPDSEDQRYARGEVKAAKLIKDRVRSKTDSFHWPHKPRMADQLEFGDWVVQVITYHDKSISVHPPGQLRFTDTYSRGPGKAKERWVFHIEVPKRGEKMTWQQFSRSARALGMAARAKPRTARVGDVAVADGLLSLWTPGGRVARR